MEREAKLEPVPASILEHADARAETHISWLFFVGNVVYKRKKPVDMAFLDFTTAAARETACRREVELNRRLAADVYLGVAEILDPSGRPIDHVVVMRRMPDTRRLAALVRNNKGVRDELRHIARVVASFHASPGSAPTRPDAASVESIGATWEASFEEMRRFVGPVLLEDEFKRVVDLVRSYLAGRHRLFESRIADGWVRDGHGDLQAEDIFCLDDGPRILDCIEFDDRLRHGDVLADVGFLAMDLEHLGHPALGEVFLADYAEFSGEHHPQTLADHYIAARAHVRAKVACLRHEQGVPASADQARGLHAIAFRHLEAAQVPLVLVGGLPGSGKSTLASRLASGRGWTVLRSDAIRKERAGLAPSSPAPARFREGLYTPDATRDTYAAMLERARLLLESGEPVILDASWTSEELRDRARRVAREAHSPIVELSCEAPLDVLVTRIGNRQSLTEGVRSDATPEIVAEMTHRLENWHEAVIIDARGKPETMHAEAARAIDGALAQSG